MSSKSPKEITCDSPKSYISDQRYSLFGSIYVTSYLLFAFAISQIPELGTLLESALPSKNDPDSQKSKQIIEDFSLTASIILLEGGIKMVPHLQALDEKWRGHLLALARIPKDVLNLKFSVFTALDHGLPNKKHLQSVLDRLNMRHPHAHWRDFDFMNSGLDAQSELRLLLLKNAYLAQANRAFDLSLSDQQDLIKTEELINTTVAALPQLDLEKNPGDFYQSKLELTNNLKMLTETLARNAVKTHSDRASQIVRIKQLGLDLEYVDQKDLKGHLFKPAVTIILGILAINLIIVCFGFWIFDLFSMKPPGDNKEWFTASLAVSWIIGAWISLMVAIFFGLFFRETMNSSSGDNSLMGYFLAFSFAFLGSSLYFLVSKAGDSDKLTSTHFWLAIIFASMAIVTMYSFTKDVFDKREAHKNAASISLVYAVIVAILHLIIVTTSIQNNRNTENAPPKNVSMNTQNNAANTSSNNITNTLDNHAESSSNKNAENTPIQKYLDEKLDVFARCTLGFVRALLIAYLVTYIIMNFNMRKSFDGRRKYPRMFYHKLIICRYNEFQTPILVKNLSFGGTKNAPYSSRKFISVLAKAGT